MGRTSSTVVSPQETKHDSVHAHVHTCTHKYVRYLQAHIIHTYTACHKLYIEGARIKPWERAAAQEHDSAHVILTYIQTCMHACIYEHTSMLIIYERTLYIHTQPAMSSIQQMLELEHGWQEWQKSHLRHQNRGYKELSSGIKGLDGILRVIFQCPSCILSHVWAFGMSLCAERCMWLRELRRLNVTCFLHAYQGIDKFSWVGIGNPERGAGWDAVWHSFVWWNVSIKQKFAEKKIRRFESCL